MGMCQPRRPHDGGTRNEELEGAGARCHPAGGGTPPARARAGRGDGPWHARTRRGVEVRPPAGEAGSIPAVGHASPVVQSGDLLPSTRMLHRGRVPSRPTSVMHRDLESDPRYGLTVTLAALVLSGLSLLAVLLIGWRTVQSGEQSARASVDAAEASRRAAEATEASVAASLRAAEATERTVAATETTAALEASSTRERRLGGVIENLVRIRTLFNEQADAHFHERATWAPAPGSKEALTRLSLSREPEGRLAPLAQEFGPGSHVRALVAQTWDTATLEAALQEAVNAIESV
jgi:hypothetical protein